MSVELVIFGILAAVSVLAALGMLASRNAVHSALFLVLNFAAVAVMYLMLNAPFIAMAQITVYAGAIMVLFLFVIMLLGVQRVHQPEPGSRFQAPLAILLAALLLAALGFVMFTQANTLQSGRAIVPDEFGTPAQIATLLFSGYLFPFEVTSLLLLVGMIGVVVLTKEEGKRAPIQRGLPATYAAVTPARQLGAPGSTASTAETADPQAPTR